MLVSSRSAEPAGPTGGANQQGVRDHNERLILSLLQRLGPHSGSDIARIAGLSPQTVSVIFRGLEQDGLLERGAPQRGKVGKPSVPMGLAADGVFSIGLKIGRRSADLVLTDFHGTVRAQAQTTYRYPMPSPLLRFLEAGIDDLLSELSPDQRLRVAGIGIAKPHELWNWPEAIGAPPGDLAVWQETDLAARIAEFCPLPVFIENDATAACRAEHVYGHGRDLGNFAYFFIGSLIGGGIVLNHSVFGGQYGNAAAFGPLPARSGGQLLDSASLYLLEAAMEKVGINPERLWRKPVDWSGFDAQLDAWIERSAAELAYATVTVCAVIDFDTVLIDGGIPPSVRDRLVAGIRRELDGLDLRGLVRPQILSGHIGGNARAIGAATAPIFSQFLLNTNAIGAFS